MAVSRLGIGPSIRSTNCYTAVGYSGRSGMGEAQRMRRLPWPMLADLLIRFSYLPTGKGAWSINIRNTYPVRCFSGWSRCSNFFALEGTSSSMYQQQPTSEQPISAGINNHPPPATATQDQVLPVPPPTYETQSTKGGANVPVHFE
jgi:hypothetical protein